MSLERINSNEINVVRKKKESTTECFGDTRPGIYNTQFHNHWQHHRLVINGIFRVSSYENFQFFS